MCRDTDVVASSKENKIMSIRHIDVSEITQQQLYVQASVRRARTSFTIGGIRRLLGNTFMAFGSLLHGAPRPVSLAKSQP